MAAAATVSPLINLTYTKSPPSGNQLFPPLPSSLLLLHPHRLRTSRDGHSRIISISRARVNASAGEDELDDIDELFSYNNGVVAEENESDDDDDAENSIDLLFRFLQSMFRKLSKRVRKASRSVLPDVIPPQLVSFGVDGVLLLASLSILKALIEVACTIGGTVFVVILLLRVIWAAISYFQSSGNNFNQSGTSYGRTQPVT